MGEQLRWAQEHEALFVVCNLHRHFVSLPVLADGPFLLPAPHNKKVVSSRGEDRVPLRIGVFDPGVY